MHQTGVDRIRELQLDYGRWLRHLDFAKASNRPVDRYRWGMYRVPNAVSENEIFVVIKFTKG